MNISDLRKEYTLQSLEVSDVSPDPIAQFKTWLQQAIDSKVPEPTAMNVATVSSEGKPSARIVLLKGVEDDGFIFYTNYESRKGKELVENPLACLTFHWVELERQVRIEGSIAKLSSSQSNEYYKSRPKGSRIGAHASPQSSVIESRTWLEERVKQLEAKYEKTEPERPQNWGGYILSPTAVEFWQGRKSRLHDRINYTKDMENNGWNLERLAP